jgi:tetratricopeptide (TPR) repeat protein
MGVDLILDEWVATTRRLGSNEVQNAWTDMVGAWKKAMADGDKVAILRYQRVLIYRPENSQTVKNKLLTGLLKTENVKYASPAVIETMLDEARLRKRTAFAVYIAEEIIKEYTETDIAIDARLFLARNAFEESRKVQGMDAKKLQSKAIEHLEIIREVFATSGEAAEALLLLGTIYRDQVKYDLADECFNSVLGVKSWRSLWPEALYNRGLCAEARRDRLKATAYYERIYVMYGNYREWAAKAYLSRAECLRKLHKDTEARETLDEMLSLDDLKELSEYKEAEELRGRMGGQ